MKNLSVLVLLAAMTLPLGCKKNPLFADVPSGPQSGHSHGMLVFTSSATDPGGDSVAVRFDWGDGDTSDWSAWVTSGAAVTDSHSWSEGDTFSVRAQAKNTSGTLSDWSKALDVTILTTWTQTFGGPDADEAFAVMQSSDGGYVVVGHTYSFGGGAGDIYVVRTDAAGSQVWAKTSGWTGYDGAYAILPSSDGGCIITGTSFYNGVGYSDVCVMKLDATGNQVWARSIGWIGADVGRSMQQTSDGGYIIAGETGSFGAGEEDVILIKTDADGNYVWYKVFGSAHRDIGRSLLVTSDGSYVILGETDPDGDGAADIYLIKADGSGNQVWAKTFDGGGNDYGYSLQVTADGGYIIAGQTQGGGGGYVYLIKTDADGDKVWSKTFGKGQSDAARSVQQTADGGYIVAGATGSYGAGNFDVYLLKTDANGDTLWTRTFGGPEGDMGYSVRVTSDGGYIVSGTTGSHGAGGQDVWLIKTDSQGNVE